MVTGIVLGCYAVASLVTARVLYGRWRGSLTAFGTFDRYCSRCRALTYDLATSRETAARAVGAAFMWPLTLLMFLVVFRPPPTAAERAEREKKLKARVAELEHEAGISP